MTSWDESALDAALFGRTALCSIQTGIQPRRTTLERRDPGEASPEFMITVTVPGTLAYRQLVLRVVESSCKLVRARADGAESISRAQFDDEVVSAFSEAFNNVAIHGYGEDTGDVRIEIEPDDGGITIRMFDTGRTFDPDEVASPKLDELPESGMGLFIMHSFMDRVSYRPGQPPHTPNLLSLHKRLRRGDSTPPGPGGPEENSK